MTTQAAPEERTMNWFHALRRRAPKPPIGVIIVDATAAKRRETTPRVQVFSQQMRESGLENVLVASTDFRPKDIDCSVVALNSIGSMVKEHPTIVTWSDQYHVGSEFLATLLRQSLGSNKVVVPRIEGNSLIGNLRISGAAVAAPAGASQRILTEIGAGRLDLRYSHRQLENLKLDFEVHDLNSRTITSLYSRAVRLDLPIAYVVETNSSCNYNCIMCPYHGRRQIDKPTYVHKSSYTDMPLETFKRVVDEISALERPYDPMTQIMVTPYRRGELLLYPHWREALAHIKSKSNLTAYFSSNGSGWTDDDIEFVLDQGLDQLQISIEGFDVESHRRIRNNSEYEKVADTVRRLIARREKRNLTKPLLQLAHTINETNFDLTEQYIDYWLEKADALFLGPENYADDANSNKRYKVEYSPVPMPDVALRPPCQMIKDNVWVDAEGTVILCIGAKQNIIGDVRKQSITEILNSPRRWEVIEAHARGDVANPVCKTCEQWVSAYGKMEETERFSAFLSADTQYYRRKRDVTLGW